MIKARKSIFSIIFSLFINIFLFIFQFILIYLMIDHYGTEFSGFTRLTTTLLAFVGSTDGGIGIMTVLFLINPVLNNDYFRINDILKTAKKSYQKTFFVTLILIILIAAGMIIYYTFLKKEHIPYIISATDSYSNYLSVWEMLIIIFSISAKNLISLFWSAPYENLLQADQNNYINRLIVLITDLLFYSLLFYLITVFNNPTYVFLIFILYSLFKSVLIRIYVKIKYPWINFKKAEIEDRLVLKTKHITLYKISLSIFYNLDLVFAAILISFSSVTFISLYLIVVSAFRNIASSLIYSFKEYFAAISNKEGRIYWNDYQKLERYTIWSASIVFIFQFLLLPYIAISLFGNLIVNLHLETEDYNFFEKLFTNQTFATITTLKTFIFLLSQPHNIMIYSKKFFNRISFTTLIIAIITILMSFIVGVLFKFVRNASSEIILYSFSITSMIFMFFHYIYLYYYSWSKLTYNSNFKEIFRNIPIILLPILYSVIFKIFYLNNSENWILEIPTPTSSPIYWQNINNLLYLTLICFIYAFTTVSINMLIFLPYWFINLITSFIFKLTKNKKIKDKNKNIDIFLHDADGVYYKINTTNDNQIKQVYTLTNTKKNKYRDI